ncbi:MAG: pilin [Patescibacteria group bacterium]
MKRLIIFSVFLALLFTFSDTSFAFAQSQADRGLDNTLKDTCTCFCKSADGAQNLDERADEDICRSACRAKDIYYLGCYQNPDNFPENNNLCWTEADCLSADSTVIEDVGSGSDWGDQESICPAGMGFCYNKISPIKIGVAINSVSEVSSFGQYISLFYAYIIPAATLLAIVMLMVGGLEYMLANGREEGISKAKTRITNAIIGLVILLAAYSIAYLIDPNLVSFNELRLPRVRTITYLDPNSSCESIEQKGGVVQPISTTQECGFEGKILSLEALIVGSKVVGIEEGGTCLYHSCEDPYAVCSSTPTGVNKYSCLRCYSASSVIEEVTAGDCTRLVHIPTDQEIQGEEKFYCEFDSQNTNECIEIVYPTFYFSVVDSLDCKILRQDARDAGSESCRAYDLVGARGVGTLLSDGVMELDEYLTKTASLGLPTTGLLTKICNEDPCNLAPPGQDSCVVWGAYSSGFVDCVDRGFLDQVSRAILESNLASRATLDITSSYQITDVNGDPAEFNPTW